MTNDNTSKKKYSSPTRVLCGLLGLAFLFGALVEFYQAVIHSNYEFWLLMILLPYMAFIFLYIGYSAKNPFELLENRSIKKKQLKR